MYLGILPDKQARLYPNKVAVSDERKRLTFKQFANRVNQLAHALKGQGIKTGDRVAILHHNCVEYLEVYFSIMKLGAIVVPINYRLVTREIEMIIRDSQPKAIFVGSPYINQTKPLLIKDVGVDQWFSIHSWEEGYLEYESFLVGSPVTMIETSMEENDVATIVYTGGTTGLPKGVMHTYRSLTATVADAAAIRLTPDDVQIKLSPIFHITIITVLYSMMVGARTHFISHFPGVESFLKIIESEGITWGTIPPAVTLQIANMSPDEVSKYDFSKFRLSINGASPLAGNQLRKALEILDCHVYNSAGMTECPQYSGLLIEDFRQNSDQVLGCAGREGITSFLKIVDERGEEVPIGFIGELIVKSDKVMKGYWNNPKLTEEIVKDGWLYTGDICMLDKEGYLFFLDRKKDMIISGSENIYSKEVEDVLYMNSAVVEAAVIGVPDDRWGEVVMAVIVVKAGETISEKEMKDFCTANLAKYKVPKYINFCDELPRTAVGKVQKNLLREIYWQGKSSFVN
jgi:acyl-CoA synthetase (AMP-forming)/AMP-acid ligase II